MSETLTLPVLALTDQVVLPGMVVPIELTDGGAAASVIEAARAAGDERLLLTPRLPDRHAAVGVVADLEQIGRLPGGARGAVVRATARARIGAGTTGPGAALWVEVETVDPHQPTGRERELAAEYKTVVVSVLQRRNAWQIIDNVQAMTDPSAIADLSGYASYLSDERKRELLETVDVAERLSKALSWTREHLAELDVAERIRDDVREGMDRTQREFLLRQQLAAIRKELGEGEPDGSDDYRARVEGAELPDAVMTAALREVDRLERSSDQSPESGWIRTWLDTVLELPWSIRTPLPGADPSLTRAREILDADHEGLEDVKDRIVEYLAVRARRAESGLEVVGGRGSGAVLALIGPPGVGKTSMGESIARALGRNFVRVALGGVRDEAEIRGHRRTYVGALPGRIVRAIKEAGSMNPVVLLDEIDKVGSDFRGDPAAALLEVLDPAQNHTFRDHYLDLDLDLSDVVFLATANVADTIPGPLLDRMELVSLDGYTEAEKTSIARQHLLPRQLQRAAMADDDVVVTDEVLAKLAGEYTREAGVRQLERALATIIRKAATKLGNGVPAPVPVDLDTLPDFVGRPRFTPESAERTAVPGVATGLAVTGAGGDVLFIEAVVPSAAAPDSKGGLSLTGQLGDVMKESAQIAVSYLEAHGSEIPGVTEADVAKLGRGVHVHFPAGAVPKDGPSAGVTMVTALTSLVTGRPVRSDVAMTGEVTLNGRVLPIGGVKQKLLAAHRAGLSTIFLPARNGPDLDDVPADVLAQLDVHLVDDVADIVALALEPAGEAAATPVAA